MKKKGKSEMEGEEKRSGDLGNEERYHNEEEEEEEEDDWEVRVEVPSAKQGGMIIF